MNTVQSTIPLLCVLAALMLAMGPARPQDGEDAVAPVPVVGDWEDLGVSVRRCGLYSETLAHDAAGNEVLCLGFKDTECFMLLLDPYTGEGRQVTFEGVAAQIWSICAHSNGMVYATLGSGDMFEVDPTTGAYRHMGRPPQGEQVVWELHEGPDGHLYGGTYPNARLARLNLRTGQIEDLGRIDPEQMYVRTISIKGDYVYCGCGPTKPAVWAYHIPTGEKKQILPEDARSGPGWGRPLKMLDGEVYIYGAGDGRYHVDGLNVEPVDRKLRAALLQLKDGRYVQTEDRSGPDRVYFLLGDRRERTEVHFDYAAAGTPIFNLFDGPDGHVYGTTSTPITLFAYDPAAAETTEYGDPVGHGGQVYAWLWRDGKLHVTAYSRCTYSVWDPALPWQFGDAPESNPRVLGRIPRHVQRAGGMLGLPDGRVLVGGVPSYGYIGGGLVLVTPEEPAFDLIEKPVGEQSPWAMVLADEPDTVIIGTDMMSGSGTQTTVEQSAGRLVHYNYAERSIVHEVTPWPDERGIRSALRVGDELFFSGRTTGRIGVMDLRTQEIVSTFETGIAAGGRLIAGPDGGIYLTAEGQLLRIDPATRTCEAVASYPGLGGFVTFADGSLYGYSGTHLLRLKLPE